MTHEAGRRPALLEASSRPHALSGEISGLAMIGRLNHVAIAVTDIAAAARTYRETSWAPPSRPPCRSRTTASPWCSSSCPTPRSSCSSRWARSRRSPSSWTAMPTAASPRLLRGRGHHRGARSAQVAGRARAGRGQAADRCARQAGPVSPSQGLLRHPGRAGAGLGGSPLSGRTGVTVYLVIWWTVLFAVLPLGVRRVENPGRGEDRGAPRAAAAPAQGGDYDIGRRSSCGSASTSCTAPTFSPFGAESHLETAVNPLKSKSGGPSDPPLCYPRNSSCRGCFAASSLNPDRWSLPKHWLCSLPSFSCQDLFLPRVAAAGDDCYERRSFKHLTNFRSASVFIR